MIRAIFLAIPILLALSGSQAHSQGLIGQEQKLLDLTRGSWAYFRNFNGRQLIYFTHLEVYRCGISQVRYSLNGDALDRDWKLQPCDPSNPNVVTTDKVYISLPLNTAESISIRLTFKSGEESPLIRIGADNKLIK
ncbi:MAG: hypothetical protein MPJ78_10935 [Hyphomicrobiaceae bacterium]|nr:hypothetical protein [Hyphomicrobiaceae bacterium]